MHAAAAPSHRSGDERCETGGVPAPVSLEVRRAHHARAGLGPAPGPGRLAVGGAAALALALALSSLAAPAVADAPPIALELPVACDMDRVCSIQKYVDHDPGPGRMDYACGRLSLDGDTGTDFRVPNYLTMNRGVAVVAAAPGKVRAARDGMADVSVTELDRDAIRGREAGNGVVIDHGNGFETQYSHLRRGSIAVAPGQSVETGDTLGLIGLSGNTEFPHVEFAVRHQGRPVDPFVGLGAFTACGDSRQPLWSSAALARVPYRATVLLSAGFAAEPPDARAARLGRYGQPLPADAEALVFWVDVSGTLAGDEESIRIEGPGGRTLVERDRQLDDSNISWFSFSGLRRPPAGWPAGGYTGRYELRRGGESVVSVTRRVSLTAGP